MTNDLYIGLPAIGPAYRKRPQLVPYWDCEKCGGTGTLKQDADPDNDVDCDCLAEEYQNMNPNNRDEDEGSDR